MDEASPTGGAESTGELVLYNTEDGRAQVHLRLAEGTVWLTQADMAELFDATPQNIGQHIKHIYEDGELDATATRKDSFQVRHEGSRRVQRQVSIYNLDMILAVGYRVRSPRGAQFRYWATTVLRDYLVKGFAMNDERLKDPESLDYFDELLERIRDIRASEKRFYQKVKDVFTTSVDYDGSSEVAKTFFATIQNKLVYAVAGHTAAELILKRIDVDAPNMGLTSWKGGRVRKGDVTISKNYLTESEISELNRLTTMFLDFAEDRARRRRQTTMQQWVAQTDRFLDFNERQLLAGAGSVSHTRMQEVAHGAYDEFEAKRRAVEAAHADADAEQDAVAELERTQKSIEQDPRRSDGGSP